MTGCDHRDIQRSIVPILDGTGTVTDGFIRAVRGLVEFIYCAQDPVHTNSSIAAMQQALTDFHSTKQSILDLRARKGSSSVINHFRIPKLELMLSFWQQIKANGTLMQYSAEVPEHLLITHCKTTFQRTSCNTRTYTDQVVEILNREETIRLFDLYLILRQAEHSAIKNAIDSEEEEVTTMDPALKFIRVVAPEKESTFRGPRPFRNHFENPNGFISNLSDVALHITVKPDHKALSVVEMQTLYQLPDFPTVLSYYIQGSLAHRWDGQVSTWNKFRIQLRSSFCACFVEKSQVVQVYPPSEEHPFSYCDAILLRRPGNAHICGTSLITSSSIFYS